MLDTVNSKPVADIRETIVKVGQNFRIIWSDINEIQVANGSEI